MCFLNIYLTKWQNHKLIIQLYFVILLHFFENILEICSGLYRVPLWPVDHGLGTTVIHNSKGFRNIFLNDWIFLKILKNHKIVYGNYWRYVFVLLESMSRCRFRNANFGLCFKFYFVRFKQHRAFTNKRSMGPGDSSTFDLRSLLRKHIDKLQTCKRARRSRSNSEHWTVLSGEYNNRTHWPSRYRPEKYLRNG